MAIPHGTLLERVEVPRLRLTHDRPQLQLFQRPRLTGEIRQGRAGQHALYEQRRAHHVGKFPARVVKISRVWGPSAYQLRLQANYVVAKSAFLASLHVSQSADGSVAIPTRVLGPGTTLPLI